ncbi:MAG: undecaprenyl-phosphate glucose phosphotransferase [bacterium]|nr:undecaprenyl-phosphate glucose phosphotransferase [bacterium]
MFAGVTAGIDSIVILLAGAVCYFLFFAGAASDLGTYSAAICFVWIVTALLFHLAGLYHFRAIIRPAAFFDRFVAAFLASFLFLAASFSINDTNTLSTEWIIAFGFGAFGTTFAVRYGISRLVLHLARGGVLRRQMVVVGTRPQVERLLMFMQAHPPDFVNVVGVFLDEPDHYSICGIRVLGGLPQTTGFLRRSLVNDVVVALPWSAETRVQSAIDQLRDLPVNIYLASDLIHPSIGLREPPEHLAGLPMVPVQGQPLSDSGFAVKTAEDYVLATLGLIVALPLMAVIALAIKIDSKGPVFFRQKRLGFNNEEFEIFKFRSMFYTEQAAAKTEQAKQNDPRVTRVGSFLRRSSLDEVPQLFNVLNGTMSLVGPRPHAIDHNEDYSRQIRGYFRRHRVKPGITGWAQVNGLRGETDTTKKMEARVRHDVYYTENWSLLFDLRIMAQTVITLISCRNAH